MKANISNIGNQKSSFKSSSNIFINILALVLFLSIPLLSTGENCKSKIIRPNDERLFEQMDSIISFYNYDKVFTDSFLIAGDWVKNYGHEWFYDTYKELVYFEYSQYKNKVDSVIYLGNYHINVKSGDLVVEVFANPASRHDHAVLDCADARYSIIKGEKIYIFKSLPRGFVKTKDILNIPLIDWDNEQSFEDRFMNHDYYTWMFVICGKQVQQAYLRYTMGDDGCYPIYDLINEKNLVTDVWCGERDR